MRIAFLAPLLLSACAAAGTATVGTAPRTFVASNQMQVTPTGPESFHVAPWPKLGAADFWCAAGEYVQQGLRRDSGTMIYRASKPPRHAGQGIDFTLDASKAQPSGIATIGASSPGFSVSAARAFCAMQIEGRPDHKRFP